MPAKKKATKKAAPAKKKTATKKSAPTKKKAAAKKSVPAKKGAPKAGSKSKAAAKSRKATARPKATTKPTVVAVAHDAAPVAELPAQPPKPRDPTEDLAQALAALAYDKKAEDLVILKVTDLTSYADCFVLASAPSERQVQAIARHVAEEMKKAGRHALGTEGLEQGHWVLVDYGAVVLHVFLSSARQYYDLEGFWADAPRIEFDEGRGKETFDALCAAFEEKRAAANE